MPESAASWLDPLKEWRRGIHVAMRILVGAVVGVAVFLIRIIEWMEGLWIGAEAPFNPGIWVFLFPCVGGLIVGLVIARFSKKSKGHGVPEVMLAVSQEEGSPMRWPR